MSGVIGRMLRRAIYGIEDNDLPLAERIRWDFAAGSVVVSSALSALGLAHLVDLATNTAWLVIVVFLLCVIAIFLFDRVITRPEPNFEGLDLKGAPIPRKPPGWLVFVRIPLSLVTVLLGGFGLALWVNEAKVEQVVAQEAQAHHLDRMQDKTTAYFETVVAERNSSLANACAGSKGDTESQGFANLALQRAELLNSDALVPSIQLLAGSHALDDLVDGDETPAQHRIRTTGELMGCPEAERIAKVDPLDPLYAQVRSGGEDELAENRTGSLSPDLEDLIRFQDSINGATEEAEVAEKQAKEALEEPAPSVLHEMGAHNSWDRSRQRRLTLERVETFTARWVSGLRAEIERPDLGRRTTAMGGWRSGLILTCILVVAFFDLSPFLFALLFKAADHRDTLESRLAQQEVRDQAFRIRTLGHALEAIAVMPASPVYQKVLEKERDSVAGSFRGPDVAPRSPRRSPVPQSESVDPGRRRFLGKVATGGVAVAGLTALGTTAFRHFVAEGTATVGMRLLRQLAQEFGLSVALEIVGRLTDLTPEVVVDLLFGEDLDAKDLSTDYRPDAENLAAFEMFDGGALVGFGSVNSLTCYPAFIPATSASAEKVNPTDAILLAPQWLNVMSLTGGALLRDPSFGGQQASQAIFPVEWEGDASIPIGGATSRHFASWRTAGGTAEALVEITERNAPGAIHDRRRGIITQAMARSTVTIGLNEAMVSALGPSGPRLSKQTFTFEDVPVPMLWR